jgi:hypothetical protein
MAEKTMDNVPIRPERRDGASSAAVRITRRNGQGETCVNAVRGVPLSVASGEADRRVRFGAGRDSARQILSFFFWSGLRFAYGFSDFAIAEPT